VEDSHRDLRITGTEQEAFTDDLSQSLDKFEIPPLKRSEVLAKVQGTGDAIVAGLQSMTGVPSVCLASRAWLQALAPDFVPSLLSNLA